MKLRALLVCYFAAVLTTPCLATSADEIQSVQAVHDAWESSFERTDIDAIEKLWMHDADVLIVTPLGTRHLGWAEAKGALKNLFALLGQTTIDVFDSFMTIDGNEASMTMTYKWSPAKDRTFPLTERYRKINGDWKIYISDSKGQVLSLRPDDEHAIRLLAAKVQGRLLDKDIAVIADLVAEDFIYVDVGGTTYQGWQQSANPLSEDLKRITDLHFQSIALIEDSACARGSLTLIDGETPNFQFTFVGLNWKVAEINFNTQAKSLAVQPKAKGKITYVWAKLK